MIAVDVAGERYLTTYKRGQHSYMTDGSGKYIMVVYSECTELCKHGGTDHLDQWK